MLTKEHILKTLENNREQIKKFGISQVGLFGSYVRDEQTAESDIDILIDYQKGQMDFFKLIKFDSYLQHIFKNKKIDVVTKNGLSEFIGSYILNEVTYAKI